MNRKVVGTLTGDLPRRAPSSTDHHSGLPRRRLRLVPSNRVTFFWLTGAAGMIDMSRGGLIKGD